MLAAQSNHPSTIPSQADLGGRANHLLPNATASENRVCPGCKNTVMTEDGGVVVAFGQSFFHVDCFKCAKCNDKVTADTNLLLLSDGSPVCANCSYSCNVCGQPILDEAIMTGDDSYHAHCFNCKVCKKRIDELVFAKTSQGIYCMDCHNERVARSRRHQQRREKEKARERAAAVAAGAELGMKLRDSPGKEEVNGQPSNTMISPPPPPSVPQGNIPMESLRSQGRPATPRSVDQPAATTSSSSLRRGSISSMGEKVPGVDSPTRLGHSISLPQPSSIGSPASHPASLIPAHPAGNNGIGPPAVNGSLGSNGSKTPAPAPINVDNSQPIATPPPQNDTLNIPNRDNKTLQKRKSYDDRPLNILLKEGPSTPTTSGLTVPGSATTRAEKRRSINPAFALSFNAEPAPTVSSPTSSAFHTPISSFESQRSHARLSSPLREDFSPAQALGSAPASPAASPSTTYPSPALVSVQEHVNGRARSASSGAYPEQSSSRPPLRPSITLDRVPARTSSRDANAAQDGHSPGYTPISPENLRRYPDGRLSPVVGGASGNPLRGQKSFDERSRHGHSSLRNSSSSINLSQTIVIPPRDGGSQPTSPSHRVDVPHGIESGTDTEGETEDAAVQEEGRSEEDELPPLPPPKERKAAKAGSRPPDLKLKTTGIEGDTSEMLDSEDLDISSELSHESSPVEQTSHATFIAPALPPIRFSMSGADFSELIQAVGSSSGTKPPMQILKEVANEIGAPLSVNTTVPPLLSSKLSGTPTSDMTIIAPEDPRLNDVTPVKRRDGVNGDQNQTLRRDVIPQRNGSPTPQSHGHAHATSISRAGSNLAQQALDPSDSSRVSPPSIDIQSDRGRSFPGTRVGLPPRPSLDGRPPLQRERGEVARNKSVDSTHRVTAAQMRLTISEGPESANGRLDAGELVKQRLAEAVADATARGVTHVKLNLEFVDAIVMLLEQKKQEMGDLKKKIDGSQRASQQYMDGLTVAQTEYDAELQARRDAEAEVTRLRVLLSGQAVQLTAISGETRRHEAQRKLSREMSDSLSVLERNLSKLKVERDMTLAEMEELSATKGSQSAATDGDAPTKLGRALSTRFDNIKSQYAHQLLPLTEQREALMREIDDLKASREAFLEETTMLNARNEELAQLNAQYARRVESSGASPQDRGSDSSHDIKGDLTADKLLMLQNLASSMSSSTVAFTDESADSKFHKVHRLDVPDVPTPQHKSKFGMKWGAAKAPKDQHPMGWSDGSKKQCSQPANGREEVQSIPSIPVPIIPSMFGRDLAEQVRADGKDYTRLVPVIVDKCIDAVDFHGLDYEGIYRKTGGSRLCKVITQLFERGDYDAFDLRDDEEFNDICSVTSVLKSYFRSLPDPLLTYALHDKFIEATSVKDEAVKTDMMRTIVSELPAEHYQTTRALMLHLHRVRERSEVNLMHARNIGVVFGPTLMRSRDPNQEFSDMAGKALSVECLVENAPAIFENFS
ncbi:hypothetical protein EIP91_008029 [Steccherinum ochraceum]|uniref:Rho-type gtpase-activating protein n=1 Tax=Steccherinum ochraceum TaxID=92696 RepID=A0A4R0R3C6_9APHY|nr:hypothetical protein EIP91_008029 [Steccherinum ochraceum]